MIPVVKEENGQRFVTCEISVQADGSLLVMVDDDYYNGTVSRDDAIELAGRIQHAVSPWFPSEGRVRK